MSNHTKAGRRASRRLYARVFLVGCRRAMKTWRPMIREGRITATDNLEAFTYDALHPPKWP